jgi:hypothetical protein
MKQSPLDGNVTRRVKMAAGVIENLGYDRLQFSQMHIIGTIVFQRRSALFSAVVIISF